MSLSDITLVILSYHRQHCLKATLQFYSQTDINLLVIDNSSVPLESNYIPPNCKYVFSQNDFATRSKIAATLISTKYAIIGADDELYLVSSLLRMKEFLDENQDYESVGGNTLAVWRYGSLIAGTWAYKRTFGYHNIENSPIERIKKHTGNGKLPLTSFFTCNLVRTGLIKSCLIAYGDAPVLATDSISVLIICGGGKSKYLNVLYWIRNWNQSPRSHYGWDRSQSLGEWIDNPKNRQVKEEFEMNLELIYRRIGGLDTFKSAWQIIIESSRKLHQQLNWFKNTMVKFNEAKFYIRVKYFFKSHLRPALLPETFDSVLDTMKDSGVNFNNGEAIRASELVSGLIPYKDW